MSSAHDKVQAPHLHTAQPDGRPWALLERFLHGLGECRQVGPQTELALQTLREGLGADAVFWCGPDEETQVFGPPVVAAEWCAQVLGKVLAEAPAGKALLLWSGRVPRPEGDAAVAVSAALVKVGGAEEAWLVALNFERERRFHEDDLRLMSLAWKMAQQNRGLVQTYSRFKDSLVGMVRCLSTALDARDPCTAGHSERTARIAVRLGKQMQLSSRAQSDLYLAGLLHDIGKIGTPDAVLLKATQLTAEETAQMREHVLIGDRIVADVKPFAPLRAGVRNHHEHFDGTGYPDGLAGADIPLVARVLAVADACDAMMSPRRYRALLTPPRIDACFKKLSGKQWDPEVVAAFMECSADVYPPIYQQGIGTSAFHAIGEVMRQDFEGPAAE
jgi:HD-GYP domain-containing protein (c-di-GMP phosphodiesterase class II)